MAELSEVEQQALEKGWKPEEEFKADPKNEGKRWRSAEDFMDRSSLFEKIDEQGRDNRELSRQVKELKQTLTNLADHNSKLEKSTYERVRKELIAEKEKALEEGDLVAAERARDRLQELKEEQLTPPKQAQQPQPTEVFNDWVRNNDWYTKDDVLQSFADGYANKLVQQGTTDPKTALTLIEKKVKEVFPEKFRNPNKDIAPRVEGSGSKRASDSFQLTDLEERMAQDFVKKGIMSRDAYIKQLKSYRGA